MKRLKTSLFSSLIVGALMVLLIEPGCRTLPAGGPMQPVLVSSVLPSAQVVIPLTPIAPTPTSDAALATPTPSATQVIAPIGTDSPASSITVLEDHQPAGMFLTILGPGLPDGYRVGPLAKGAYAVGPNARFLVYVSNTGGVYVLRFGSPHFIVLANLKRALVAPHRDDEPAFQISFSDAGFAMFLVIDEYNYGQRFVFTLPHGLVY